MRVTDFGGFGARGGLVERGIGVACPSQGRMLEWLAIVFGAHQEHESCMLRLRFDDTGYSVVVKNRGTPPNSWRWEIYRAGRSNPIRQSPVLFRSGDRQQSRKGGAQGAIGQAKSLTKQVRSVIQFHVTDFGREVAATSRPVLRLGRHRLMVAK